MSIGQCLFDRVNIGVNDAYIYIERERKRNIRDIRDIRVIRAIFEQ